jgi:hypothetical protein
MSDVITGNTQLGSTKQDLIAAIVQRELAASAMFLPTITDLSMFAVKGAKSISFPKAGSFTVENRASGATGNAQTTAFTTDQMLLNVNAYVSWLVDSTDAYQSNIDVLAEYIKRASSAHARYVDSKIITELEAIAFNSPASTAGSSPISDVNILSMRKQLFQENADRNNCFMALSVDQEAVMLGIDKFVRYDALGVSKIPEGAIGKIYGIPVFVSNLLETGQVLMWDKASLGVAFQKGANYAEQQKIEYGTNSKLCAVDQLFGVKGLQIAAEGVASGKSPLVVKLQA